MAIPWLIDALREAGVPVIEEGNWRDRSVGGPFDPIGVLWHHTAARSSPANPAPSVGIVINGRPDLAGPLCHALVDYNGVFHLIAAGRANHAGEARASGPIPAGDGNTMLIGWEIDYEGDPTKPSPQHMTDAQYQNSVAATAAVLRHLGRDASYARGHRETSVTGKPDPAFIDLDVMRADVAARMAGGRVGDVQHQSRNADGSWRGLSSVPAPGGAVAQGTRAAVAALKDGAALVVDIGPDGVLYHQTRRADGTWSGFQVVPAPGNAAAKGSEVAVAGLPDGSVLLADVGPDGVVYYQVRRADGSWSGFKPVPAPGNGAARGGKVAVAGLPDGSAFLVDVGPDGALYHQIRRPNDTWTGFQVVPAPGNAAAKGSEVAAAGLADGSVLLADVGPDGVVYYQVRRADGSWSGFKPVPAPGNAAAQGSKVAVAGLPDGSALLADVGPDGVVYQQIRRPNDTWTGFVAVPGSGNNPAHGSDVAAAGLPDGSTQLVIVNRPPGLAVSIEDLRAIFGSAYDTAVVRDGLPSLNAEMQRGGITTPPRVAAFLATLRHESGFRYNAAEAGNSSAYRGRGYIQLTGVGNYQAAGNNLGHDFVNSPDDAATLAWSAPIARYYWTVARPLNADADALNMGLVSQHIGYAWSAAEDNARCADFKAVLQYYTGNVPAGINCIRPGH